MRTIVLGFLLLVASTSAYARDCSKLSDTAVRAAIVQESRQSYYNTGRPCACPEDSARNGSRCGARSASSRPGGASPKCYPAEVTAAEVRAYCS
jgi:hypothetical protein